MGSVNLGNLLVNMQTGTVNNGDTGTGNVKSKSNSHEEFHKILNKAQRGGIGAGKKVTTGIDNRASVKKAGKAANANLEELEEEMEEVTNEVMAAILDLLSQQLNIPVEEVTANLEKLGLTPIDLLNENGFSQFITDYYGKNSGLDLLTENADMKDISKLFTKIEEVSKQIVGDQLHKVIEQTTGFGQDEIHKSQMVVTEDISNALEEGIGAESVNSIWKPKEEIVTTDNEIVQIESSDYMAVTHDLEDLGLTVPVHTFGSTINLKNDAMPKALTIDTGYVKPEFNLTSQIVDHIEVTKLEQMKEIKIQLSPKELGQLTIKMVEKNGMLVAEIKVESEKTKEFILNEINSLKESLSEQGLEVANVQVDVRQNDQTKQMYQQRQKSSKRIQEIIAKHLQELEDEEASEVERLDVSENEIDYMI